VQSLLEHTARYIQEFDRPPRLLSFTGLGGREGEREGWVGGGGRNRERDSEIERKGGSRERTREGEREEGGG
jgi:hypothetical protein